MPLLGPTSLESCGDASGLCLERRQGVMKGASWGALKGFAESSSWLIRSFIWVSWSGCMVGDGGSTFVLETDKGCSRSFGASTSGCPGKALYEFVGTCTFEGVWRSLGVSSAAGGIVVFCEHVGLSAGEWGSDESDDCMGVSRDSGVFWGSWPAVCCAPWPWSDFRRGCWHGDFLWVPGAVIRCSRCRGWRGGFPSARS